jgi:hypothetical protein
MKAISLDNLIEAAIQDGLRDKSEISSNPVYRKLKNLKAYDRMMRIWDTYDGYDAESHRGKSAKL